MAPTVGAIGVLAVSTLGRAVAVLVRQHVAMSHVRGHGVVRDVDLDELVRGGMADGGLSLWSPGEYRTDGENAQDESGDHDGHNQVSEMSQYVVLLRAACVGSVATEVGGWLLPPATLTFGYGGAA